MSLIKLRELELRGTKNFSTSWSEKKGFIVRVGSGSTEVEVDGIRLNWSSDTEVEPID